MKLLYDGVTSLSSCIFNNVFFFLNLFLLVIIASLKIRVRLYYNLQKGP